MFRFTIRELVLLTLVVAMGVAWALDHWRLTEAMRVSDIVWQDVIARDHLREISRQAKADAMKAAQADVDSQPPPPPP
jgi:hypothetical protein